MTCACNLLNDSKRYAKICHNTNAIQTGSLTVQSYTVRNGVRSRLVFNNLTTTSHSAWTTIEIKVTTFVLIPCTMH